MCVFVNYFFKIEDFNARQLSLDIFCVSRGTRWTLKFINGYNSVFCGWWRRICSHSGVIFLTDKKFIFCLLNSCILHTSDLHQFTACGLTIVFLFSLSHVYLTEYSVLRNKEHSSLSELILFKGRKQITRIPKSISK